MMNESQERESLAAARTSTAHLSPCRTYRYSLTRPITDHAESCYGPQGGTVVFVGLNPSTADETTDDPTIRRCIRFAQDWGFDTLKMVNLYAYRATKPDDLWLADDPVGPENDHALSLTFGGADSIVAAWGANARPDRVARFAETFAGWRFHALGLTKDGAPRHPLYMRADTQPFAYLPRVPS